MVEYCASDLQQQMGALDRLALEELTMTHELLANTLGVRHEGITEAARKLRSAGLITYRRDRIAVIVVDDAVDKQSRAFAPELLLLIGSDSQFAAVGILSGERASS